MLAEPQNYFQAGTEADPEPGLRADATLQHRGGGDFVQGRWPDSFIMQMNVVIVVRFDRLNAESVITQSLQTHLRLSNLLHAVWNDVAGTDFKSNVRCLR